MERLILGLVVLLRVVGPKGFYREVFRRGFIVVI